MADVWNAMGALSAAISAIVVVAAAVYARSQVSEAKRGREVTLLLNIYERYNEEPLKIFRHRLVHGPLSAADSLSADDDLLLRRNLDLLEFLAISIDRKLLDFDTVRMVFRTSPPLMWEAAQKYLGWTGDGLSGGGHSLVQLVTRYAKAGHSPVALPQSSSGINSQGT